MRRFRMDDLYAWKQKHDKLPLILQGARQVGKTWLMQEFGRQAYDQVVYVNFENNERMQALFSRTLDIPTLIMGIEAEFSVSLQPETVLIIFDEIQEVPKAITSLKYFSEYPIAYDIICAGSLLGIGMEERISFPVGKVSFLQVAPMNFEEFLEGIGEQKMVGVLRGDNPVVLETFREKLIQLLKVYLIVGGMPLVVSEYADSGSLVQVRELQADLLRSFELDFSKHAPSGEIPRIFQIWRSIPAQLAREQRKFLYGLIQEGARAKAYEKGLVWLQQAGIIRKVSRITKPALPLSAYEDPKAFKLFFLDVGLLGAMSGLPGKVILDGDALFQEFKGALTEQYVIQELGSTEFPALWYWSAQRAPAEVDALLEYEGSIIPLEIKAGENLRSKSLKSYYDRYTPAVAVRASLSDLRDEGWMFNLPLYAVSQLGRLLEKYIRHQERYVTP